jgi:BASS family bile acid:Na+ symporter
MPIALAIIMLGIGLGISFGDFRRVFAYPKAIITGLICQMVVLPLAAFVIAFLWPADPVFKVGLVLIACCPGGTASNLVTHLLRGRVALSVSLTSFNSFLIIFTIPMILGVATYVFLQKGSDVHLSFWRTLENVCFTIILPVVAGILIKNRMPDLASRLKKPLRYILPAILLFVFAFLLFLDSDTDYGGVVGRNLWLIAPALILNISTIVLGFIIAGMVSISHDGKFTIGIEMGLQNSALAIFIGHQLLQSAEMVAVALVYSGFSFFTTLGMAYLLKTRFGPD